MDGLPYGFDVRLSRGRCGSTHLFIGLHELVLHVGEVSYTDFIRSLAFLLLRCFGFLYILNLLFDK